MRYLRFELLLLVLVLGAGAFYSIFKVPAEPSSAPAWELIDADLEPFRAAFNAASSDVRAVLLAGPT